MFHFSKGKNVKRSERRTSTNSGVFTRPSVLNRKTSKVHHLGEEIEIKRVAYEKEFDDISETLTDEDDAKIIHHNSVFQTSTRRGRSISECSQASPVPENTADFFECVGFVSVTMRMCSQCYDSGKPVCKKDKYYVNTHEIAQRRTIFCHSCMAKKVGISLSLGDVRKNSSTTDDGE